MKQPKLIYVEWVDHASGDGWARPEHVDPTPLRCATIGWLLKETKDTLVLNGTACENGVSGSRMYIVKSCIRRRKQVKL